MGRDFMLTGSGFGAFPEVFPAYLPRGESDVWYAIHNDYLELFLAGGVITVALVLWLTVGYAIRAVRSVRIESKRGWLFASLGLALGLLALAAHEAVDFNLQLPANALLFAVAAAIAASPSVERERETPA
jgi:O-antigen ligase